MVSLQTLSKRNAYVHFYVQPRSVLKMGCREKMFVTIKAIGLEEHADPPDAG